MTATLYEQLGGQSKLRAIINAFVDRMFDDVMIGFFFRNTRREHLKELEFQHAAEMLGGEVAYRGRALEVAHGPLRIFGAQFSRRLVILEEVLAQFAVPPPIVKAWLDAQRQVRHLVVQPAQEDCRATVAEVVPGPRRPPGSGA